MSVFQQSQEWLQTFIIYTPLEIAREMNSGMIMVNFYLYVNVNNIVLFKKSKAAWTSDDSKRYSTKNDPIVKEVWKTLCYRKKLGFFLERLP